MFIGCAPIIYHSKTQNTVEYEDFDAEFVAIKDEMEADQDLCCKFLMLGIEVEGHTNVLYDNNRMHIKSTITSSTLNKNHNSIAYHVVLWASDSKYLRVCFDIENDDMEDILTENLEKKKHNIFSSCIKWKEIGYLKHCDKETVVLQLLGNSC